METAVVEAAVKDVEGLSNFPISRIKNLFKLNFARNYKVSLVVYLIFCKIKDVGGGEAAVVVFQYSILRNRSFIFKLNI